MWRCYLKIMIYESNGNVMDIGPGLGLVSAMG